MAIAIAFLVLLLAAPAIYAADYIVGDSSGWETGVNYDNWASSKKFAVGDTLLFQYGASHSVSEVSQVDYTQCNTGNAIKSYSDGNSSVTLTRIGSHYFLCPTFGHCGQGMKLSITVGATSSPTPDTTAPTTPVSTPTTPTTPTATPSNPTATPSNPTTPSTRRTPTPSTPDASNPSGATGDFYRGNALAVMAPLVLAPLLVLMG